MLAFFDSIADIYDETRGLPEPAMRETCTIIAKELSDCRRVLDVGCGTGRFTAPLQEQGINITGIDISGTMLRYARRKNIEHLVLGDACALPFKSTSFDAVISIHVLHLVENCEGILREITRVGRGKLLTVIYTNHEFHVRKNYEEALARAGHVLKMPGMGEWGLLEIVPPIRSVTSSPFHDLLTIGQRLRLLEERKHTFARNVPADSHDAAIDILRREYTEHMDTHPEGRVDMVVWDMKELSMVLNSGYVGR